MDFVADFPVWIVAGGVFILRVVDVSMGTLRTISLVQGRRGLSVLIGFFEVLIWIIVVSQVIVSVRSTWYLVLPYAAGFAVGNFVGIMLERWIGMGTCVVRMIVGRNPDLFLDKLRSMGLVVTTFAGQGRDGERWLMFTSCRQRQLPALLRTAAAQDPGIFYTVDRFSQTAYLSPLPHPTGWRAVFKK